VDAIPFWWATTYIAKFALSLCRKIAAAVQFWLFAATRTKNKSLDVMELKL